MYGCKVACQLWLYDCDCMHGHDQYTYIYLHKESGKRNKSMKVGHDFWGNNVWKWGASSLHHVFIVSACEIVFLPLTIFLFGLSLSLLTRRPPLRPTTTVGAAVNFLWLLQNLCHHVHYNKPNKFSDCVKVRFELDHEISAPEVSETQNFPASIRLLRWSKLKSKDTTRFLGLRASKSSSFWRLEVIGDGRTKSLKFKPFSVMHAAIFLYGLVWN